MKTPFLLVISVIFLAIIISSGCTQPKNDSNRSPEPAILTDTPEENTDAPVISTSTKDPKELSEFQVEACKSAEKAKTCNTRLKELAIVSKSDCCASLSVCC